MYSRKKKIQQYQRNAANHTDFDNTTSSFTDNRIQTDVVAMQAAILKKPAQLARTKKTEDARTALNCKIINKQIKDLGKLIRENSEYALKLDELRLSKVESTWKNIQTKLSGKHADMSSKQKSRYNRLRKSIVNRIEIANEYHAGFGIQEESDDMSMSYDNEDYVEEQEVKTNVRPTLEEHNYTVFTPQEMYDNDSKPDPGKKRLARTRKADGKLLFGKNRFDAQTIMWTEPLKEIKNFEMQGSSSADIQKCWDDSNLVKSNQLTWHHAPDYIDPQKSGTRFGMCTMQLVNRDLHNSIGHHGACKRAKDYFKSIGKTSNYDNS